MSDDAQNAKNERYRGELQKLAEEFHETYNKNFAPNAAPSDFTKVLILGTGAFGTVYLVKKKETNKPYAMKMLEKELIVHKKQVAHSFNEKKILCALNFPFCVYMKYFFKDNVYIYFILPYIPGGEMFMHLRKCGKFDERTSKFYASQVLLALEYLHTCKLVYRDLKPENILIDRLGYIKLTDFGFCKILKGRAYTLCGTPEYLAPEVILSKGYGQAVDWWAFGVLIFEMAAGHPPFFGKDPMLIYEKIVNVKYRCPSSFSTDLKDLVLNTLQADSTLRFGNLRNGATDFKNHRWFKEIEFESILCYQNKPPFIPKLSSIDDSSYFMQYDKEILKQRSVNLYASTFADF